MILPIVFINKTKDGFYNEPFRRIKGAPRNIDRYVSSTISLTFAIGSALAASTGILYKSAPVYEALHLERCLSIKAFVAAVLGGDQVYREGMLGGILLGLVKVCLRYIFQQSLQMLCFRSF